MNRRNQAPQTIQSELLNMTDVMVKRRIGSTLPPFGEVCPLWTVMLTAKDERPKIPIPSGVSMAVVGEYSNEQRSLNTLAKVTFMIIGFASSIEIDSAVPAELYKKSMDNLAVKTITSAWLLNPEDVAVQAFHTQGMAVSTAVETLARDSDFKIRYSSHQRAQMLGIEVAA